MGDLPFWKHLGRTSDVLAVLAFLGFPATLISVLALLQPPVVAPSVQPKAPTEPPPAQSTAHAGATSAVPTPPTPDRPVPSGKIASAGELSTSVPNQPARPVAPEFRNPEPPSPTTPSAETPIDRAAPRIDPTIVARQEEGVPPPPPVTPSTNISIGSTGWVHAGTYSHLLFEVGTWESRKLDFSYTASPPRLVGTSLKITSTVPLNVRTAPPDRYGKMGEILGKVAPSQSVKVIGVAGEKDIWLKIKLLPTAGTTR